MTALSRILSVTLDLSGLPDWLQEDLRRYLAQQPEQAARLDKALRYLRTGAVSFVGDSTDDCFVESERDRRLHRRTPRLSGRQRSL